jgi:nucleotide-binding universal stress UspA family protein
MLPQGAEQMAKKNIRVAIALRKIIAAIDFSPASEGILAHAASIARRYKSKLYITHVVPTDIYKSVPAEVMPEAVKEASAETQAKMDNLLRLECVRQVDREALIHEGPVAPTILRLAAECRADLLVIGTRGQRGLDRLLQGSVAEEVFRMAPCPVLIVPPSAAEDTKVVRNILYPTSFSENSLRAAPYAFSLARRHRARLILLHVLPETAINTRNDFARTRAPVEKRLRALVPEKGALSREPVACVEFGGVAERVVRVSLEYQVDLIVLGITTAGAAVAHLDEGVTYKIVRAVSCPVLTIRN